jgi:glyoxylase-like metal-dependent hydrolase (beta-lactamase superfamily II)
MALEQILPSLYRVPLKAVNAFVIDLGDDGLVLIDAGTPDDTKAILDVVGELGRRSADVRHILVTHCHADHAGGLAELKKATGAPAYMHPADAEMSGWAGLSGPSRRRQGHSTGPSSGSSCETALRRYPRRGWSTRCPTGRSSPSQVA